MAQIKTTIYITTMTFNRKTNSAFMRDIKTFNATEIETDLRTYQWAERLHDCETVQFGIKFNVPSEYKSLFKQIIYSMSHDKLGVLKEYSSPSVGMFYMTLQVPAKILPLDYAGVSKLFLNYINELLEDEAFKHES